MVNSTTGSRPFIAEPATRMIRRTRGDRPATLPGSVGSSSPGILTKPPKGSALIEYKVSPRLMPSRRGGKPTPNSSTRTPASFAAVKWPSSWTKTTTPKTAMNARIVTT